MKVSVVIPTYNREKHICDAIDSALQQTTNDMEIIVVDDGSTDNTRGKIKGYGENIKYIKTKNQGPASARNVGMKAATGEYIAWLDSDDLYYPFKLELQVNILDAFPDIDMVYTEFSAFDDHGYYDEYHLKKYHNSAFDTGLTYDDIFTEKIDLNKAGLSGNNLEGKKLYCGHIFPDYFQQMVVFTNSIMFRHNILDKIGFEEERYGVMHDLEFVLRICKNYKIAFVDVPTYKLRYHEGQISGQTKEKNIEVTIDKQEKLLQIGEEYGLGDNNFYQENLEIVHNRLATLHKALAVPLMLKGKRPKKARYHFKKCAEYDHPERFLRCLTYFPYILRRIIYKLCLVLEKV